MHVHTPVALALFLLPLCAVASVWQCEVKGVYETGSEGRLQSGGRHLSLIGEVGDSIIYDEASGIVRQVKRGSSRTAMELKFQQWQISGPQNGATAIYLFKGPASNPAMLLKIKSWERPVTMTFLEESGRVLTGTCNALATR